MHDWVVWCRSKEGAEDIRSFELSGKEIFLNFDGTKSKEEKNKENRSQKKAHRGQSVRQVMVEAKQHQNGNERGSHFMLGSQRSHCHKKNKFRLC